MDKILKILIVGPQASGKGTQAKMLSEKFNIPIFSTGNILRQKIVQGDELGKQLAGIMNKGELVSDEMVNQIIKEKIEKDGKNGYILDGYPRNLSQAEFLDGVDELIYVFEVEVTDAEAIRRISGRRTCNKCQEVYHLEYNPPQVADKCDKCGGELIIREDEQPAVVVQRLKNYHELTEPILKFYKAKNIYYKINGEQSIGKVNVDILKILNDNH